MHIYIYICVCVWPFPTHPYASIHCRIQVRSHRYGVEPPARLERPPTREPEPRWNPTLSVAHAEPPPTPRSALNDKVYAYGKSVCLNDKVYAFGKSVCLNDKVYAYGKSVCLQYRMHFNANFTARGSLVKHLNIHILYI